jgi:FkbM family methyltransferase
MSDRDNVFRRLVWRLRLNALSRLGREMMLSSRLIQKLLCYEVADGKIVDRLSVVPLKYDLHSDVGKKIFLDGTFEEAEIRFLEQILDGLDGKVTIIDVGANIGLHSIRLTGIRNVEKAYAFEPSSDVADMLRHNIEVNALASKIHVVRSAVSDSVGQASFYVCDDNAYSGLKNTQRKSVVSSPLVPVTTIDQFVRERGINNLALIKIDVEGFETEVIRGATDTLKRMTPELFVEIYKGVDSNPDPEGTVKLLISLGYNAYVFSQGRINRYVAHDDKHYNYYFTQRMV